MNVNNAVVGANKRSCANALCMWTENSVPCPDLIQVFNIGTAIVLNRSFNIKLDIALTTPFFGGGGITRLVHNIHVLQAHPLHLCDVLRSHQNLAVSFKCCYSGCATSYHPLYTGTIHPHDWILTI